MNTSDLKIATCSVRDFQPSFGVAVQTTVGMIRNIKTVSGSKLAPYGLLKVTPWSEFHRRYVERIDGLADKVDAQLLAIAEQYPGETLVLLCFEDVRKDRCHRELAAKWLTERYGIEVPELGAHDHVDHVGPLRPTTKPADLPGAAKLF